MYESEKNIIGCLLQGVGDFAFDVLDKDDFEFSQMAMIFTELKDTKSKGKPVDFQKISKLVEISVSDLAQIMTSSITQSLEGSVEQMKNRSAKRKYERIMLTTRDGEIDDIIDDVITELQSINMYRTNKSRNVKEISMDYIDLLSDRKQNLGKEIKSGLAKMDNVLGGFHKKEVTLIGARPSVGKSAFGLQIACHAAKTKRVLFVSLEMADIQILERMVARFSGIEHWKLKTGKLERGDWETVTQAMDYANELKLSIDTTIRTIGQLRTKILSDRPELVIVDYIGLMSDNSKKFKDKREEMSSITHKLKATALDYDVPIIALAQLGRDSQERKPNLSSLRDSGSLEEDADNVIFLHRLNDADKENFVSLTSGNLQPMLIMIEKQRNGECLWIKAGFNGSKFQFMEME